jgi:hypothetical protein
MIYIEREVAHMLYVDREATTVFVMWLKFSDSSLYSSMVDDLLSEPGLADIRVIEFIREDASLSTHFAGCDAEYFCALMRAGHAKLAS